MFQTPKSLPEVVAFALREDVGSGDVTAALIPADATAVATVITRETCVIAGCPYFDAVFAALDPAVRVEWQVTDGAHAEPNQLLCTLRGPARSILTGERAALNFLQTLSGTATKVAEYVAEIAGTKTQILDTRKTLPGLRDAQKYAVLCGGGRNHRKGLYDAILIKENHIVAAGSITAAVGAARRLGGGLVVEVEVEILAQLEEALAAGADIALLDNMSNEEMRRAVVMNNGRAKLEASGGITLASLRDVAMTGVDYISLGTLTKDVKAVDLSMRFEMGCLRGQSSAGLPMGQIGEVLQRNR